MAQKSEKLIEVASFGQNQPIGVTVAPSSNRLFVSFPYHEPFLYGLTEIVDGKRVPYPDTAWNHHVLDNPDAHFVNVQDLYADDRNCLWVLDSAPAGGAAVIGNSKAKQGQFKLMKISLDDNAIKRIYTFDDLPKDKSALNDVCVDNSRELAYLSDPGLHAIIVLDLNTGKSRVVLQDDKATLAKPGLKLHLDGKDVVDAQGNPFVSNVNGIALSRDYKYFYFRAINQTKLYRIATDLLTNIKLSDAVLSKKVELAAETGICHGMISDQLGNVYLSDSPNHAIQYLSPDKKLHMLVQDDRIIWPDSFGIGNDGFLYFSASQMNRLPKYNSGEDKVAYPYAVYKVKLPQ
ncbi:gluconolactonase [Mucilaginibacter terrenus]|uniref:Gluconolactonase n=1 Tax=Mucilaginibacter terrenus TaxID=2482727 RepID=A0A3E2NYD1_9SPHI|nr:gluconolactonase [Mucilaginibacter terrenus]